MDMHINERGDELWFGLLGPIPIVGNETVQRQRSDEAAKIAQTATSLPELVALVSLHVNPLVRSHAVPRLAARFRNDPLAKEALVRATRDVDWGVRYQAVVAVADFQGDDVLDAIAERLEDEDANVRTVAAEILLDAGDSRAPSDPETWAHDPFTDRTING